MKKVTKYLILGLLVYLLAGTILPYAAAPELSAETKASLSQMVYTDEGQSTERVQLLTENGQALEERIRLIAQAQERIWMSTFEFRSDESGKDMLAALQAAAERGVSVQILVDGMPALLRLTGNEYFCALSAMEQVEIRVYNPVNVLKPWQLMGRQHDKYLIADDTAYILGGRNTYDFFLGDHDGYINYDWDVLVWQQGEGRGASMEQLAAYVENIWNQPLCRTYHDDEAELEQKAVARAGQELRDRYQIMQQTKAAWFEPRDYSKDTMSVHHIQLLTNPVHSRVKEPVVYAAITQLMAQAEEEVRFHTPYIICNDWMLDQLENVCDKVPEVVMMTNSIANNGNPFGAMDYWKNKDRILETGVQILEYDQGVSYHGKCFTIDDRISGIGSFNWDMRSTYINTEMMLVIDSEEVNAALRSGMEQYEQDALAVADEDSYRNLDGRTPQPVSTKQWIRIVLLRGLAGWMRFLM